MQTLALWQAFGVAVSTMRKTCIRVVEFSRFLVSPVEEHEDKRRREYILNVILILSVCVLVIFEGVVIANRYIIFGESYAGLQPGSFLIFILLTIFLFAASKRGYAPFASYTLISAFTLGALYSGWVWGVSLPTTLLLTALVIVTGSILVGSRFGFFSAMFMIAALAVLGVHEVATLNVPDWRYEEISATDIVAYGTIFLFISFITWLSNREIKKSLSRAHLSEQMLEQERDTLEARVAKRTDELISSERERMCEMERIAEFGALSQGLFHDLMNPLFAISLSLETIRHNHISDDHMRELETAVSRTLAASRRMDEFMTSIRHCIGRPSVVDESNIHEECRLVRDILAYKARMANVDICTDIDRPVRLHLHPMRLHQLLLNLVSNGIDACDLRHEDNSVTIRVRTDSRSCLISVADTGGGLSDTECDRVFVHPFSTKSTGTGFGLIMVRSIVEKELGGTIKVASKVGQGSTFTICIPSSKVIVDSPALEPALVVQSSHGPSLR